MRSRCAGLVVVALLLAVSAAGAEAVPQAEAVMLQDEAAGPAEVLLVPYLAWVGFAGLLNYDLWRMNP